MRKAAAAAVASCAWAGLVTQFVATYERTGSVGETLWILARFFTVLTNLLVALTFTAIVLGRRVSPFWLGGVTLAIVLVGVVYTLLLRGLVELSGGAVLADIILHKIVPVAVPIYWLLFAPKGQLDWRNALLWMLYPLTYFAYAMVRGMIEDRYAYPFIDVAAHGFTQVAINAAAIAAGFAAAGLAFVAADSLLGRMHKGSIGR